MPLGYLLKQRFKVLEGGRFMVSELEISDVSGILDKYYALLLSGTSKFDIIL